MKTFKKQMKKRRKFFPWLKFFLRKVFKESSNDLDAEVLQYLLQNVEEEFKKIIGSEDNERKTTLFETITDLFRHYWWRIQSKNVPSDASSACDEHENYSNCCSKLLYYIIYIGIILSEGCPDSKWIKEILIVIDILPKFDAMVCNSLLLVNNLQRKYHCTYSAILKHVLCTKVVTSITEPIVYIKIIMLFRRLKKLTKEKIPISVLKSTASKIEPPLDTVHWLSSLDLGFSLEKYDDIAQELLSKKYSNDFFHKLYQIVTGSKNLEKESSSMGKATETEKQNVKTKVKKSKHERKPHKSHFKKKLKDPNAPLHAELISDCLNSAVSPTSSQCKKLTKHKGAMKSGESNQAKHKSSKKKKEHSNSKKSKIEEKLKECNSSIMDIDDEFLNKSFAEISKFSKIVFPQQSPNKVDHISENKNITESNILPKAAISNEPSLTESLASSNKRKHTKSSFSPQSGKRIKLEHNGKSSKDAQSVKKLHSHGNKTLKSFESISQDTEGIQKKYSCTEESDVSNQWVDNSSQIHEVQVSLDTLNNNSFDTETVVSHQTCNPSKRKQSPSDKIPRVSLVDFMHFPSAVVKTAHIPDPTDIYSRSSLHCELPSDIVKENDNTNQIQIDSNRSGIEIATNESSGIIKVVPSKRKLTPSDKTPRVSLVDFMQFPSALVKTAHIPDATNVYSRSSLHCELSSDIAVENNSTNQVQVDCDRSSTEIAANESSAIIKVAQNIRENVSKNVERNFILPNSGFEANAHQRKAIYYSLKNCDDSLPEPCSSLISSVTQVENETASNSSSLSKELFSDHSCGESEPLFDRRNNKNLHSPQNHSVNNKTNLSVNSEMMYGDNFKIPRAENSFGNISATVNNTSSCVVECKIANDFDPNNPPAVYNNEHIPSIKLIINVSCRKPEHISDKQNEHIFGDFKTSTNALTLNSTENIFNSPLCKTSSIPKMPELTPYYDDPPLITTAINSFVTPSSKDSLCESDNMEVSKRLFLKDPLNKPKLFSSTPKSAPNTLPRNSSTKDSNFITPDTSDCESSNEWDLVNVNLNNSSSLLSSLRKSPVDNVLKRLNSALSDRVGQSSDKRENNEYIPVCNTSSICSPTKTKPSDTTLSKKSSKTNYSYRSSTEIYSDLNSDLSDGTISPLSGIDPEELLISEKEDDIGLSLDAETNDALSTNREPNVNVLQNRKNIFQRNCQSDVNLQEDSEGTSIAGYNLRRRKNQTTH